MVVLLVTLVGPFWRLAVTLGDLMVPAWDNGDIRAYNMNCTAQCIVLSSSKLMGISGRAMPHTIKCIVHELQSRWGYQAVQWWALFLTASHRATCPLVEHCTASEVKSQCSTYVLFLQSMTPL